MKKYAFGLAAVAFAILAGCAGSEERDAYLALCRKAGMSGEVLDAAIQTFDEADDALRKIYIKSLKEIIEKEAEELQDEDISE